MGGGNDRSGLVLGERMKDKPLSLQIRHVIMLRTAPHGRIRFHRICMAQIGNATSQRTDTTSPSNPPCTSDLYQWEITWLLTERPAGNPGLPFDRLRERNPFADSAAKPHQRTLARTPLSTVDGRAHSTADDYSRARHGSRFRLDRCSAVVGQKDLAARQRERGGLGVCARAWTGLAGAPRRSTAVSGTKITAGGWLPAHRPPDLPAA
jgi:hypothetical protein